MKNFCILLCFVVFVSISAQVKHTVAAQETLYGISKKYNITVEKLEKLNPFLTDRTLKIGDVLIVSDKEQNTQTPQNADNYYENYKPSQIIKQDNQFIYVLVGQKETIYHLIKKYKTTEEILKKYNSFLQERGLKVNDELKIPTQERLQEVETPKVVNEVDGNPDFQQTKILKKTDDFVYIETGSNETLQNLARNYNVSTAQIIEENPFLQSTELRKGFTLKIPVKSIVNNSKSESNNPYLQDNTITKKSQDDEKPSIELTYFLPFSMNDKTKAGERKAATNFLAGSKIALDSLFKQSKNIKVRIVDSGSEDTFSALIDTINFSTTDAVIGPFKQKNLVQLAEKYPTLRMVSPVKYDDNLLKYKNIIIAEIDDNLILKQLANEIKSKYNRELVYIIAENNDTNATLLKNILAENNAIETIQIINSVDEITIPQNLVTEKYQNILTVFISKSQKFLDEFEQKITQLDTQYITPFSLQYFKKFDDYDSIFSKTGITYTYVSKADLADFNTQKTLQIFKKQYCESPDKYAILGFDITYDIISRMDEEGNLVNMTDNQTQIANGFQYKEYNGAFINTAVKVKKQNKQNQ